MARPCKYRRVQWKPEFTQFSPCERTEISFEVIKITYDELEALRLSDIENDYQADAARQMHVSRQTYANILRSARKKVAESIIHGKKLVVKGGQVHLTDAGLHHCTGCHHEWHESKGQAGVKVCPRCHCPKIDAGKQFSDH